MSSAPLCGPLVEVLGPVLGPDVEIQNVQALTPGETMVPRIRRSVRGADETPQREALLRQCADELAAIHRADPSCI